MIKTYEHYEKEYTALRCAAAGLECRSTDGTRYTVQDCYFDFSQDWAWTTIVAHGKDGANWQILCPRDHDLITSCDIDNIAKALRNVISDHPSRF